MMDFLLWVPKFVCGMFVFSIIGMLGYLLVSLVIHFTQERRNYVKGSDGKYLGRSRLDYILFVASIAVVAGVAIWQWVKHW